MKRFTILLMAFMALTAISFAQEEESYTMFDNTRIVVKTDKIQEFGAAMANHNKTYHNDGPYHANVWSVTVGEKAGEFVWSMGPCTFTELDGSPDSEAHLNDWITNVMPNVERLDGSNMWRLDSKHSYVPDDDKGSSKLSITVFDIQDEQAYRFKDILDRVLKVYKAKNYKYSFTTYWPQFTTNSEEDVAIVSGFEKWARFDEDRNFKKDFIEINGEGSWDDFLKDLRGTINGSKDEVWVLVKELSGE